MYPTPFWWYYVSDTILAPFFTFRHLFMNFLKCAPRLHRKHNSEYRHKAFLIKSITFSTSKPPDSLGWKPGWRTQGSLDPSKNTIKTNEKSTFPFFGPAPTYTHHTCHLRSSGSIFHLPIILFSCFFENVLPAFIGSTILNIDTKHF